MITCNLKGGLGNQLFQIFAIIACAIENNIPFCFTSDEYLGGDSSSKRFTYWNSFLNELMPYTAFIHSHFSNKPTVHVNCGQFEYNPLPYNEKDWCRKNVIYDGYFQSYKYFQKYENEIFDNFICLFDRKKEFIKKYPDIFNELNEYDTTISMHFRIGDYKHLGFFHPIMSLDYYKKALTAILLKQLSVSQYKEKKILVLYFCEADDNETVMQMVEELIIKFPRCIFKKVTDKMEDYNQMLCMSFCKHNIIANSSFSWFGAYFNANQDKVVCYPKQWFCGQGEHINTSDLFPPGWLKIE